MRAAVRARRRAHAVAPEPSSPLVAPTQAHPRWRLHVFDRAWPWRATSREAMRDAVLSHNARWDPEDRTVYLDAVASIQRDPPYKPWLLRDRRPGR